MDFKKATIILCLINFIGGLKLPPLPNELKNSLVLNMRSKISPEMNFREIYKEIYGSVRPTYEVQDLFVQKRSFLCDNKVRADFQHLNTNVSVQLTFESRKKVHCSFEEVINGWNLFPMGNGSLIWHCSEFKRPDETLVIIKFLKYGQEPIFPTNIQEISSAIQDAYNNQGLDSPYGGVVFTSNKRKDTCKGTSNCNFKIHCELELTEGSYVPFDVIFLVILFLILYKLSQK